MAAIKVTKFTGRAPKQAPELLQENAAQVARNCKLYSGDLIPYHDRGDVGDTAAPLTVQGLHALRDPLTNDRVWLSWPTQVKVATPSVILTPEDQQFFYTGDGSPKVSDYALATSSLSAPYPNAAYLLGLPLPTTKVTPTPGTIPVSTVSTIARAASVITVVTSGSHGLSSGAPVKVTGITDLTGTYSQLGTTLTVTLTAHGLTSGDDVPIALTSSSSGTPASGSYSITVTDANTFTATMPASATDSGTVVVSRRAFNADSIPITVVDSTTFTFIAPGYTYATKAVTGVSATLASNDQLRYYVYTWVSDRREESINSEPSADKIVREGQTVVVSNIPVSKPFGNYNIRGVRLYRTLTGTKDAEFFRLQTLWFPTEITGVERESNIAAFQTREKHMLTAGDRILISGMSSNASFDGAFTVRSVLSPTRFTVTQAGANVGPTVEAPGNGKLFYDVAQNKDRPAVYWTTSSFTDDFDSRLMFTTLQSEDYAPPPATMQGLTAINDGMFVGFVGNSLYFSEPGKPHAWPTKYIQVLEYPIVGLASISGSLLVLTQDYPYLLSGSNPGIMDVRKIDSRYPCVSARSIVNTNLGVMYATHDGLVLFSIGSGPLLATKTLFNSETFSDNLVPSTIVATYYDDMYVASHSTGSFTFEATELGGVFVDCDENFSATWYDPTTNELFFTKANDQNVYLWDAPTEDPLTMEWKSKVFTINDYTNFGAARVIADFADLPPGGYITFKLWANKSLIFERNLTDNKPFRLPSGYRSDTFEFGVVSNIRVRAIHVAETVLGLKQV